MSREEKFAALRALRDVEQQQEEDYKFLTENILDEEFREYLYNSVVA